MIIFIKSLIIYPDYKILSFETLLYSQWRQQCFVCFRKLFLCLWVNFYFWKIKWLARGIECLTEVLETIVMKVYVHRTNFAFSFPVDLSVQVILPYDGTTITSSTFIGLPQFPWHFEIDFGKCLRWYNSNSFSAVARGSLNEIVHGVVQCWLLPEVLFSMRSTTISGSVVFLSLCW